MTATDGAPRRFLGAQTVPPWCGDPDWREPGVLLRADVRQQAPGEDRVRVVVWPVDDPVTEFSYDVPSPPPAPGEEPAARRPPAPGQMMRPRFTPGTYRRTFTDAKEGHHTMTEKPENVLWIGAIGTGKTQIGSCTARLVGRTDSEQRVVYWDPANLGAVDYAAMLRGLDGGGDRL